jgi:hypothetical protein
MDVADTPTTAVNPNINFNKRDYGPAGFNVKNNLSLSYVYSFPAFGSHWQSTWAKETLSGWQLSGIASFIGGLPQPINYIFVTATDVTGASGVGVDSRVDLSCNPNLGHGHTSFYRAFNPTCEHAPTKAELGIGNAGKYPFVGPGVENFDTTLFKNFPLGNEGRFLQFRLETYNTLNHAQFTTVANTATFNSAGAQVNQQFGQYTAAAPSRRLVLALKFYF